MSHFFMKSTASLMLAYQPHKCVFIDFYMCILNTHTLVYPNAIPSLKEAIYKNMYYIINYSSFNFCLCQTTLFLC